MRQKLQKFMYGRNGTDELARFTSILSVVMLLISMFLSGLLKSLLFILALALLVFTYYRVFSKNLAARRKENNQFVNLKFRRKEKLRLRKEMWSQRKEYKFFKCPSCKAVLRVPRGKGKIRIVCKKCGTAFEKKT